MIAAHKEIFINQIRKKHRQDIFEEIRNRLKASSSELEVGELNKLWERYLLNKP